MSAVVTSRRAFLATALGGLAAAPRRGLAQGGPPRIGFIPLGSPARASDQALVDAFRDGLRTARLVENRHFVLEIAWIAREPDTAAAGCS